MYSKLASGAGHEEEVRKSSAAKRPTDWSERFILYEEDDPKTQSDLWALPLVDDRKPKSRLSPARHSSTDVIATMQPELAFAFSIDKAPC
jgi:hypothetical protein